MQLIEAKVVGEIGRGAKVGNKLPLKITVRYEVNQAAYHEAMTKMEKSLLMNSSSWGKVTFLATSDLKMKREYQNSINEEIGKRNVILVSKGLSSEKWRSFWHYYLVPRDVGDLVWNHLCKRKLRVKLSLLDKDGQCVAIDEFMTDDIISCFRWFDGTASKYENRPFNSKICYFLSPVFFNFAPDIQYMTAVERRRDIPLVFEEIKLIQSVKCELRPSSE